MAVVLHLLSIKNERNLNLNHFEPLLFQKKCVSLQQLRNSFTTKPVNI